MLEIELPFPWHGPRVRDIIKKHASGVTRKSSRTLYKEITFYFHYKSENIIFRRLLYDYNLVDLKQKSMHIFVY